MILTTEITSIQCPKYVKYDNNIESGAGEAITVTIKANRQHVSTAPVAVKVESTNTEVLVPVVILTEPVDGTVSGICYSLGVLAGQWSAACFCHCKREHK